MDANWVLVWREGGGDAGRGLDASPEAAADVDVCTMAAKPVMYLSFYNATFFPDGRRRRAKPTGSAPVQQNKCGLRINQHQICHKQCLTKLFAGFLCQCWSWCIHIYMQCLCCVFIQNHNIWLCCIECRRRVPLYRRYLS